MYIFPYLHEENLLKSEIFKYTWLKQKAISSAIVSGDGSMEPEGSLPHSQVPVTCPYPEPAQLILSSNLRSKKV